MSKKLVVVVIALVACAALAPEGSARGYGSSTRWLGHGVGLTSIVDPRGPYRIKVLSVKLDRKSTIDVALSNNVLPDFETTSSMARRHGALAAINGDYAQPDGRPVYGFAEDGWLAQTPSGWGRNFALDQTETAAFVGHGKLHVTATYAETGLDHAVDRVNAGPPSSAEIAAYTRAGGLLERPPLNACAARLRPLAVPAASAVDGLDLLAQVEKSRCSATGMRLRGGIVLATPAVGKRAPELTELVAGQQVGFRWTFGWPGVMDAIGGNPNLVENGGIVVGASSVPFYRRHPRTGVGVTADGRALLVTVDGRHAGYSVGMTPRRFGRLFVSLGAEWAINLDGGGSTTMYAEGKIRNRPSDGSERAVSSALLVLPGPDQPPPFSPPRRAGGSGSGDAARALVTDPASTGGLADALAADGRLPETLRSVAGAFDRAER